MASADASYLIDIASQFNGASRVQEQLAELERGLGSVGLQSDVAEKALAALDEKVKASGASLEAANAALGEGESRYRELEKAADMAARAVAKAEKANGGIVPIEIFEAAEQAKQALNAEADSLRALTAAADKAKASHAALVEAQKRATTAYKNQANASTKVLQKANALEHAANLLPASLKGIALQATGATKRYGELSKQLGEAEAKALVSRVAFIGAAAAVAAVTVAVAAAAVALTAWGVSLANSARNASLAKEAYSALSSTAAAGAQAWDSVSRATGLSSDRLRSLTDQLISAKVSAADMPTALQAVATAEAALGQGGASQFIERLKGARTSVQALAAETEAKFGGVVSQQLLSLEAQGARLKSNIGKLFGGLQIEGLLSGLRLLVNLFDENTESGQALKFLFETIFQPLVDAATKAFPLIEGFFLGMALGAMKIYIAVQPVIKAVGEFLGFNDPTTEETFKKVAKAGEVVAYIVGAIVAVFAVLAAIIVAKLVIAFALVAAKVALLVAIFATAYKATQVIIEVFGNVWDYLKGLDFAEIGRNIIQGLANGIKAAGSMVLNAISGVVSGAINTAKKLLGIASPSKVMFEFGGFTGEGFADGLEAEKANVNAAFDDVLLPSLPDIEAPTLAVAMPPAIDPPAINPPDVPAIDVPVRAAELESAAVSMPVVASQIARRDETPTGETSSTGTGNGITLENVRFEFNGVEGAENAEARFRELLVRFLRNDLGGLGGVPNGA